MIDGDGEMSECKKIDLDGTGETALSRRSAGSWTHFPFGKDCS